MDVYWQCEDCDSAYDPSPGVFCPFCGGKDVSAIAYPSYQEIDSRDYSQLGDESQWKTTKRIM